MRYTNSYYITLHIQTISLSGTQFSIIDLKFIRLKIHCLNTIKKPINSFNKHVYFRTIFQIKKYDSA